MILFKLKVLLYLVKLPSNRLTFFFDIQGLKKKIKMKKPLINLRITWMKTSLKIDNLLSSCIVECFEWINLFSSNLKKNVYFK